MNAKPDTGATAGTIELISEQDRFEAAIRDLTREGQLAVDTEAASFHRYTDRVYLLQLSSRTRTVIVDPLAVTDLSTFGRVLADPGVEVVFHDADYDLRLLRREFGFEAHGLFDTRVAAQLLDEPGIGLAALLEKYFGVRVDKRFQRADWSARPLTEPMLAYAASDTTYLPALRDLMRQHLSDAGRLDWAREEFQVIEGARWETEDQEPGWLRMKGAKVLKPRQLAVLRALYEWRDEQARRHDRAPFRVMNNEPILEMAKHPPTDLESLKKVPGIGRDTAERRGALLLDLIDRALKLPDSALPRVPRSPRPAIDPTYEGRLDRLKAVRNRRAAAYPLQPGVLCPNGTLEAIARLKPATLEELAQVSSLRRWQLREIGQELLEAIPEPPPPGPAQ